MKNYIYTLSFLVYHLISKKKNPPFFTLVCKILYLAYNNKLVTLKQQRTIEVSMSTASHGVMEVMLFSN